jgi:hypothetical protein
MESISVATFPYFSEIRATVAKGPGAVNAAKVSLELGRMKFELDRDINDALLHKLDYWVQNYQEVVDVFGVEKTNAMVKRTIGVTMPPKTLPTPPLLPVRKRKAEERKEPPRKVIKPNADVPPKSAIRKVMDKLYDESSSSDSEEEEAPKKKPSQLVCSSEDDMLEDIEEYTPSEPNFVPPKKPGSL